MRHALRPTFRCCLLILAAGWMIAAHAADAPVLAPVPALAVCPNAKDIANVQVTQVYKGTKAGDPAPAVPSVQLRDAITIRADNLATLLNYEQCSPLHKRIVLFLDGRPLPTLPPYPPARPDSGTLSFLLNRNEEERDTWTYLLGKPSFKPRVVAVSIGLEDGYAISSKASMALDVIPSLWLGVWMMFFVALLVVFFRLAARTEILRDVGPPTGNKKPYSLARTQAAVWFFLIVASYLFIGIITGDYSSPITSTVLTLMGISGGTVVGSSIIDQSKQAAATAPAPAPLPADAAVPAPAPPAPRSWWRDILSDGQGVNFHRFQMAVWTFVLGIVFVEQVYKNLSMPDFDNTLLGLLGISAGTYLGLKTTSEGK